MSSLALKAILFCETLAALAKRWALCMFNGGHLAHLESDMDSPDAFLNLTQKEHNVVNMILYKF